MGKETISVKSFERIVGALAQLVNASQSNDKSVCKIKIEYEQNKEYRKPQVGDWGYFWDNGDQFTTLAELIEIDETLNKYVGFGSNHRYANFSHTPPTHIADKLNLNP